MEKQDKVERMRRRRLDEKRQLSSIFDERCRKPAQSTTRKTLNSTASRVLYLLAAS